MSSEPTSSAAAAAAAASDAGTPDSDNLRRSKRKKFTLDVVAAAHGNNQKKSRRDPHDDGSEDYNNGDDTEMEELSVMTGDDSFVDEDADDSMTRRRSRRSTTVFQGYQQDTMGSFLEMNGPYACQNCPSRYSSKSSLANHVKMHQGEKRKFACELCNFSSATLKSLSHHENVHKAFGVLSAPTSPAVKNTSLDANSSSHRASTSTQETSSSSSSSSEPGASDGDAAPTHLDVSTDSLNSMINGGAAPQLMVAAEEPFALEQEGGENEEDVNDDGTPPPILEREDDGPPVLQREVFSSMEVLDDPEEPEEEEPEEPEEDPEPVIRKSGRSAKPTQKKLEQTPVRSVSPMDTSTPTSSSSTRSQTKALAQALSKTPTPPKDAQVVPEQKGKRRRRCPYCPYSTSTLTKLTRHEGGHQMKEGFMCPEPTCEFMTRKAGFLSKHFILHKGKLPWPPKYMKRVGKKLVEVPEMNVKNSKVTKQENGVKEEAANRKRKYKEEVVEEEDDDEEEEIQEEEEVQEEEQAQANGTKIEEVIVVKKEVVIKEEKVQETVEKKKEVVVKKKVERTTLRAQAQIKSHGKLRIDDITYKKCNVEDCTFRTVSATQLIVHKAKMHEAQSAFPSHPFLCFKCGIRKKTFSALRAHKLTRHLSAKRRFHRTYHLKEIIGDKFYIKHFINNPIAEETKKVEEPEKKKTEEVVAKKVEEFMEEDDGSGDESFDSNAPEASAESLAALNTNDVKFCCNLCPYRAPTAQRIGRHHNKHFTNDQFKCKYCNWSSRSENVIITHEKLHLEPLKTEVNGNSNGTSNGSSERVIRSSSRSKSQEPEEKTPGTSDPSSSSSEQTEFSPVQLSLQKWCHTEKSRRPDLDDPFSRKMIDGIKGFQCSDCPYTSKYRGDMRSHKKRHDVEQTYRCVQCTYTTNRPVSLKDHLKQHGAVNSLLINPRNITVNQGLRIGSKKGKGRERVYKCTKCPFTTLTIGGLWRHYRNHRPHAKINICSNCSFSSIDQRKMEDHVIIHLGLGNNEPMAFVKRVDNQGRPVSSLTDLNSVAEKKANKRRLEEEKAQKGVMKTPKAETPKPEKTPKLTKANALPEKQHEATPEPPTKRRRASKEGSPDSDYSTPGPSQPTRQLSERATRNRINYSLLSRNGSGKPTPSASSANLEYMEEDLEREPEEAMEVSHYRIRQILKGFGPKPPIKCIECPYKTSDPKAMAVHRYFHGTVDPPRTHVCTDCSFNTYTGAAILQHLFLHTEGVYYDPNMCRKQRQHRKGDIIPPGVKGLQCKNCTFKTANIRAYDEHMSFHRHQMINRVTISLKRQPPKVEYQRPKFKHQFVAKNARYCKKCTFKCVSQSHYIEHLDRHGWNQLYKCYLCDYSDNNKSVVDYHQLTHHIVKDQTIHGIAQAAEFRLENGIILKPEFQTGKPTPTPEEFVKRSHSLIKCASCEYFCHVSSEMAFHMSVHHMDVPNATETINYLHMGLVPPNAQVTTVI